MVTMGLFIPLIVFAGNTTVVLGINSYLNVMSVAVSSIVLLCAMLAETHQKQIAELQEKRAQEDHTQITTIHTLVLETLANQQQEIEDLKQIIAALQGQAYERKPRQPVADLREMHPRGDARYQSDDATHRMRHLRPPQVRCVPMPEGSGLTPQLINPSACPILPVCGIPDPEFVFPCSSNQILPDHPPEFHRSTLPRASDRP